nr:hypothetical protein Iba_chr13dCG4660 [Ipomoea batatas]
MDPKEHDKEELTLIAKVCNISRVQSSLRDGRPGVGTSREQADPEDEDNEDKESENDDSSCNDNKCPRANNNDDDDESSSQSTHPPTNASKKDDSDDSFDISSSNDSDDDNNEYHGTPNHPQEEDEPRRVEDEKMSNPVEEEGQAGHCISSPPQGVVEPSGEDICDASHNPIISEPEELAQQSEPAENVVIRESQSSARDENVEASRDANHDDLAPKNDEIQKLFLIILLMWISG